jgi:adenylate kinase family enzyme
VNDAAPRPGSPTPRSARRFRVIGNSGAGKTVMARAIAARVGVPHLELDAVFWDAGWTHRDRAEAHARLAEFLAGPGKDGWATDGNWNSTVGDALDTADVIVWLDYPRRTVMRRVIGRTLRRGITRRELWHGNRERLTNLLKRDPEENIVRWAWTQHAHYRAEYARRAATDPRVVRLRTPREASRWLDTLPRA